MVLAREVPRAEGWRLSEFLELAESWEVGAGRIQQTVLVLTELIRQEKCLAEHHLCTLSCAAGEMRQLGAGKGWEHR